MWRNDSINNFYPLFLFEEKLRGGHFIFSQIYLDTVYTESILLVNSIFSPLSTSIGALFVSSLFDRAAWKLIPSSPPSPCPICWSKTTADPRDLHLNAMAGAILPSHSTAWEGAVRRGNVTVHLPRLPLRHHCAERGAFHPLLIMEEGVDHRTEVEWMAMLLTMAMQLLIVAVDKFNSSGR